MGRKSPLQARLEYEIARPLFVLSRRASPAARRGAARLLGRAAFRLLGRARAIALRNLELAFGAALTSAERVAITRRVFENMAATALETASIPRLTPERLLAAVAAEGEEHLGAALARGNGLVVCAAHLGNWEMAGSWLVARGYPVHGIYRPLDNPLLDAEVVRCRTAGGGRLIPRRAAALQGVRALRRNEVLYVLVDQNEHRSPVFVDFFGIPAATSAGVSFFHRATGAPVVCMTSPRGPDGTLRVRITGELPMTGDSRADLQAVTAVFEEAIRADPGNWLWVHPRWKKRPPGEASLYPGIRV